MSSAPAQRRGGVGDGVEGGGGGARTEAARDPTGPRKGQECATPNGAAREIQREGKTRANSPAPGSGQGIPEHFAVPFRRSISARPQDVEKERGKRGTPPGTFQRARAVSGLPRNLLPPAARTLCSARWTEDPKTERCPPRGEGGGGNGASQRRPPFPVRGGTAGTSQRPPGRRKRRRPPWWGWHFTALARPLRTAGAATPIWRGKKTGGLPAGTCAAPAQTPQTAAPRVVGPTLYSASPSADDSGGGHTSPAWPACARKRRDQGGAAAAGPAAAAGGGAAAPADRAPARFFDRRS